MKFAQTVFLVTILGLWTTVHAQSTGTLRGTVTDARTGEALIGAAVQLEGTILGAATNVDGYFEIQGVTPRTYTLIASYVGYQPREVFNLVVKSGGNADIALALEPTVIEAEGIVVTPDAFATPDETPLSIRELSQVEIATYPGGNNDVAKVIQSLPGVSPSPQGFRNDVIIRGGAPNENVYYLDGVEIPNINHFATQGSAGGPVGLLNVSFFESVTLSASSFPARYDNALSSVLQFDQRNGNASELQTNLRIGASEAAVTTEGPLFKRPDAPYSNTTFIASVRRSYLQLLFELLDLPFLPDYWDYQYKVNHRFDARNEISLVGLGSLDNFRINVPSQYDAEQQATLDQVPIIKQWTTTAGLSWKHRFTRFNGLLTTTASTNVFNNDFRQYRDNENLEGLYFQSDSREWDLKLRSEFQAFSDRGSFSGGMLVQRTDYNNQSAFVDDGILYNSTLDYARFGVFGQISRTLFDGRMTTSVGVRADGNSFTDSGANLLRTVSPRVSASYHLDNDGRWKATASAGRYFKLPPNTILGFQDASGAFVNRDAEYIRSDHAVVGVNYEPTTATQISTEGFYKHYDRYPVSVRDSVSLANLGGDFEVFGNEAVRSVGRGRSYGLEVSIQQKLRRNLYGIAAYTLYWSEFTGFDRETYLPSAWDNRHLLTFTGGYKFPRNFEAGARLRVAGPAPYATVDEEATLARYPVQVYDYSTFGQERLGTFVSLDIRVDKRLNFAGWTLDLYLDVQNVLANNLPSMPLYGLSRDGSGALLSPRSLVEIEQVSNAQVLPTIGVVVDF